MRETPKRSEPVGISPEEAMKFFDERERRREKFKKIAASFQRGEIPTLIKGKIPSGATYRGYTERDARCEPFREWHINGYSKNWEEFSYHHLHPDWRNPLVIETGKMREGFFPRQKERPESYLALSFEVAKEKSKIEFKDDRGLGIMVKLVFPLGREKEIESLLAEFKKDPASIAELLQMLDPHFYELCPVRKTFEQGSKAFIRRENPGRRDFSEEIIDLTPEK